MSETLSAEELAWLSNSETFRDPDARWDTAWLRSALATIDTQDATIAELQRELEGYRQALEKYGTHRSGCTWWKAYSNKPECSCGFERVLAGKEAQGD